MYKYVGLAPRENDSSTILHLEIPSPAFNIHRPSSDHPAMASKNINAQSGGGLAPLSDAKSQRGFQAAREFVRACEGRDPLDEAVAEHGRIWKKKPS